MATNRWPLFDYFPSLARSLNPIALCNGPTPVMHAQSLSENAWIKCDDVCAEQYGGNKIRKLEFVFAEIKRSRAERVITFAPSGSNAAVATAMVCQQQDIDFDVYTFPQPNSASVCTNRALIAHYQANVHPRSNFFSALSSWAFTLQRLNPKNYFMYPGCSQHSSVFAYVNAAIELGIQAESGECAMPKDIVVATGSGTTVAGLSIGAALALPGCTIHAVQSARTSLGPIDVCSLEGVKRFRQRAWKTLKHHSKKLSTRHNENIVWHDSYLGGGYGADTLKSKFALERGKTIGLSLDPTYTGKSFAAFCDLLTKSDDTALFWNTHSSAPLPENLKHAHLIRSGVPLTPNLSSADARAPRM